MSASGVIVLGRDDVGIVAESDGMRYYLTECCGASAKGGEYGTVCRACYEDIDPALGGLPDSELTVTVGAGGWVTDLDFKPVPLRLTEVFGDGIPYETWKAQR